MGAADGARALAAAVAFGLGIGWGRLIGDRPALALLPILAWGALAAVGTLLVVWIGSDVPLYLEDDGTLEFPLGYRAATATLFLAAALAAIAASALKQLDWRLRGLLLGLGTLCLCLAALGQSRPATAGFAVGAAVLIALHPARLRILAHLVLAATPVVPALPFLLAIFGDRSEAPGVLGPLLDDAALATAVATMVATAVGAVVARDEGRLRPGPGTQRLIGRAVTALAALVVAVGAIGFVVRVGDPVAWVGDRAEELVEGGSPERYGGTRLTGGGLQTDRSDFWRVALEDGTDEPLTGRGAGGFHESYLLRGESEDEAPEDPHSVEMELLSELGFPGLLLFIGFLAAVVAGLRVRRRLGSGDAALVAAAAAAGIVWLIAASIDRIWEFPPVTLPILAVLGAACVRPFAGRTIESG